MGRAKSKLGQTPLIERGDAAVGRSQECYTSLQDPGRVFIVFEGGETDLTFYLFTGGPVWNGSDRCTRSSLISPAVETASGLRLGQTPDQVEAILGKPTAYHDNVLLYWGATKHKPTPETLRKLRKENPQMSEEEFDTNFQTYDLTEFIEARFTDSKLGYLALSNSGD